jgi:hypothetical protein
MNAQDSANPKIWVVTIHDREPQGHHLSFDLKEVLLCLGPGIHRYVWAILDLECTGKEAQAFCAGVEASRRSGKILMVSWEELIAACQKFGQTLEATIIGTPQRAYTPELLEGISDLTHLPKSPAELVIRAIDSSFFEILTKNYDHVKSLKHCFRDVREEDPANYFAASVQE